MITTEDFQKLMSMKKVFVDSSFSFPPIGEKSSFELASENRREKFFLDINRSGRIELKKMTIQNRHVEILVRLDIDSGPHRNPDGTKTSRNHIHIYREGEGDSWAIDLDVFKDIDFNSCKEPIEYLVTFCNYCNILLPDAQVSM